MGWGGCKEESHEEEVEMIQIKVKVEYPGRKWKEGKFG